MRRVSDMYRAGIDLGGTNIAAGLVDDNYNIVSYKSIKTNTDNNPYLILDDIVKLVHDLCAGEGISYGDVVQIGAGMPGTANKDTGILEYSNNLKFDNVPIISYLEEKLDRPVKFDNDANTAAYGEYLAAGKDKDIKSFIMITLGTGVGGGVITDGKLLTGCNYAGAELGHIVIEMNGAPCTCGRKGCFEAYGSVTALISQAREAMKSNTDSLLWKYCHGNSDGLNGKKICDCVREGDKTAVSVMERYTEYLVEGITNIINIFQPEQLCIGGGISASADLFMDVLKAEVRARSYNHFAKKQTEITKAVLGNNAGIIGAAFLE